MKKVTNFFGVLLLSCTLLLSYPVVSQTSDNTTSTTTTHDNNDDDTGKWGLAGLLGLLGLLGLKKKDNESYRSTSTGSSTGNR